MQRITRITPFLWFDDEAEQAAEYYTSIFDNSRITSVTRYTDEGKEHHHKPAGTAMTVSFELDGQPFTALNGGPNFQFTEAISFQISCATQEEVDHFWEKLTDGGDERAQQCGWLKDRFGVSWQVVPDALMRLLTESDPETAKRVTRAMLQMKKLDIAGLERAAEGVEV